MAASRSTLTFGRSICLSPLILGLFFDQLLMLVGQVRYADSDKSEKVKPSVFLSLLVRNKAHALPCFFGYMEKLDYPKDRIAWWIRSDHSEDNTASLLRQWVAAQAHHYHSVDIEINETESRYEDQKGPTDWLEARFTHVMKLRQAGLEAARKQWADYVFMLDSDVLLENPNTLSMLINQEKTIVAPMLNTSLESTYSNFWGGMRDNGYYQRVKQYFIVLYRHRMGLFEVPMVHTALLIHLKDEKSQLLSYDPEPPGYEGPYDDIIRFAFSAKYAGVKMHILNTQYFGHVMIPLHKAASLEDEKEGFTHVKCEAMVDGSPLEQSPHLEVEEIPADKLGFDQVYLINLKRRPERLDRMKRTLKELGIQAHIMDAVDGQQINDSYLKEQGIKMMDGYADPYHKRPMTMGEIGCFMSHYNIWLDVLKNGYERIVIFEDDVRFEAYFRTRLFKVLYEVETAVPDWDLIYLGRKRLLSEGEEYVEGSESVVYPLYSYWTLSYILSKSGAEKLVNQKPLEKMLPVDEYLPIMFDKHPLEDWKTPFSPRNLIGLSAEPLLVYPTHYTGEDNYISDTEDSIVVEGEEDSGIAGETSSFSEETENLLSKSIDTFSEAKDEL